MGEVAWVSYHVVLSSDITLMCGIDSDMMLDSEVTVITADGLFTTNSYQVVIVHHVVTEPK